MIVTFENQGKKFSANLANPIDLSIPMKEGSNTVNAWYVDDLKIEPVRNEHFLGSVAEGGNVNFRNIFFNPHGHGTHTECVGHIDQQVHSINDVFERHFFTAELVTIQPETWASDDEWRSAGDHVILERQLDAVLKKEERITLKKSPDMELFGKSGAFDSMGLVNLLVAVEESIEEKFDKTLVLADERAMSQKKNPFATIDSLAQYILTVMENENG